MIADTQTTPCGETPTLRAIRKFDTHWSKPSRSSKLSKTSVMKTVLRRSDNGECWNFRRKKAEIGWRAHFFPSVPDGQPDSLESLLKSLTFT